VDRDNAYDPFPAARRSEGERPVLSVSVEDAKHHLPALLKRVETGEEIVLTRDGRPVARLVDPESAGGFIVSETIVHVSDGTARRWGKATRTAPSTDDGDQLPALPDCGPRDGRHGVDDDRGYPFGG
jgi:prevent-host-death family protein